MYLCTKALLESAAAPPSDQPGASGGAGSVADRTHAGSNLQGLSRAAVDRALDGVRGDGAGCVSVEHLREEVEDAIEKLVADGTGLRDYANVAVGGQVVSLASEVLNGYFWRVFLFKGVWGGMGRRSAWVCMSFSVFAEVLQRCCDCGYCANVAVEGQVVSLVSEVLNGYFWRVSSCKGSGETWGSAWAFAHHLVF